MYTCIGWNLHFVDPSHGQHWWRTDLPLRHNCHRVPGRTNSCYVCACDILEEDQRRGAKEIMQSAKRSVFKILIRCVKYLQQTMFILMQCQLSFISYQGAFWGMILAQIWGIVRFILDMVYPAPPCGEPDNRPKFISEFHPYYHTLSQIILAFLVATIISLATEKPAPEKVNEQIR